VPGVPAELARQIVEFVQKLRQQDLYKLPGIAETIDWAQTLLALNAQSLDEGMIKDTLGVLLKYQDDLGQARRQLSDVSNRKPV
jgi:MoxR-like ATPase